MITYPQYLYMFMDMTIILYNSALCHLRDVFNHDHGERQ